MISKKIIWLLFTFNCLSKALPQTEEIFWWWDDGLISYEQVEEFLVLLEHEDEEGFCSLMEAYLSQSCSTDSIKTIKKKYQYAKMNWKTEIDSLSELKKQRLQFKANFTPFHLEARPDSIFTLTYKRKKNTAILGNLTYSHLNTGIPLEPMKGYFGRFFIRKHSLSMLFTTDTNYGIQSHFIKGEHQLQLHLYSFFKRHYFLTRYQNKTADFSLWYDIQKKQPLARLRLKTPSQKNRPWQWKSELYIHSKDSLQSPLLLPKSVAQSTLWSTQNQKFSFSFLELNLSQKISIPIDTGATVASADASLKATQSIGFIESTWSCRDIRQKCGKPQWRFYALIHAPKKLELFSKIRLQGNSFSDWNHRPQLLFGITLNPEEAISFKNEFLFVENESKKGVSWRQSLQIQTSPYWSFLSHFEVQIQKPLSILPYRAGVSFSLEY